MEFGGVFLLFFMMIVVGLELTTDDFRRVRERPRAVLVGTLGQVTLLPLAVFALLSWTSWSPVLVGGAILATATPGAGVSNVLTMLAGANVALSVTLTAVGSLLAVVTLPLLMALGFQTLLDEAARIPLPVAEMIGQLALFVLLPIGIGMGVRRRNPEAAARWGPRLQHAVMVALGLLIVISVAVQTDVELDFEADLVGAIALAALWIALAAGAGYLTSLAAGCRGADRFALVTEFVSKNAGLSAIVAISAIGRLELAFFIGPYVAIAYPLNAAAAVLYKRRAAALPEAA